MMVMGLWPIRLLRWTRGEARRNPVAFWTAVILWLVIIGGAIYFCLLSRMVYRWYQLMYRYRDTLEPAMSAEMFKRFGHAPARTKSGSTIGQRSPGSGRTDGRQGNDQGPVRPHFVVSDDRYVVVICLEATNGGTTESDCLVYDRQTNAEMRMVMTPMD